MRMALGWMIAVAASAFASTPAVAQDVSLCPASTYRYDAKLHQEWGVLPGLAGTMWTDPDQLIVSYDWADCRPGTRFVIREQASPRHIPVYRTIEPAPGGGFRQLSYPNGLGAPGQDLKRQVEVTGNTFVIDSNPWMLDFRRDGETLRQKVWLSNPNDPGAWYSFRRIDPSQVRTLSKWNDSDQRGRTLLNWQKELGGTTYYMAADTTAALPGFAIEVRDTGEVVWTLFDWNFFPYSVVTFEQRGDTLQLIRNYDYPYLNPGAPQLTGPIRIQKDGSWRVTTNGGEFIFFGRADHMASITARDEAAKREYRSDAPSFMEYTAGWRDNDKDFGKYGSIQRLARGLWPTKLGLEYWWETGQLGMTLFNPQGTKKLGFCQIVQSEPADAPVCSGWYENGDPLTIKFSGVTDRAFVRDGKQWQADSVDWRLPIGKQRFTTFAGEEMRPVRFYSMGVANVADGILQARREKERLDEQQRQQLLAQAERARRETADRLRAQRTPARWTIPEPARHADLRGIIKVPDYGGPKLRPRFSSVPRTMGGPLMGGGNLLAQPYPGMPLGLGINPMMPAVPTMYPNSSYRAPGFGTTNPLIGTWTMTADTVSLDRQMREWRAEDRIIEKHRAEMDWNSKAVNEIEARRFTDQVNRDNPNYKPDPMYYNEYRDRGSSGNVTVNVNGSSGTSVCVAAAGSCN